MIFFLVCAFTLLSSVCVCVFTLSLIPFFSTSCLCIMLMLRAVTKDRKANMVNYSYNIYCNRALANSTCCSSSRVRSLSPHPVHFSTSHSSLSAHCDALSSGGSDGSASVCVAFAFRSMALCSRVESCFSLECHLLIEIQHHFANCAHIFRFGISLYLFMIIILPSVRYVHCDCVCVSLLLSWFPHSHTLSMKF